ncbi:nickel-dependent hydrogenase large subunit [Roseomonas aerophila]|uniref:Nickel-dependent hydrogenase large subunit n=1 Tax=Teichococcus aerophilus TaxID=1224513 RepID=A0ABR7RLD8_9PROT|nr:nickel-dependent hydrogenase large subunit [Pseudoroseomonas aerophila]MBC9206935.1 nickel-dependent hydrogenase large subunit [Pseudoroseomonas aerophila]
MNAATRLILAAPLVAPGRHLLEASAWAALPAALRQEPELDLLALWAEPGMIHVAFLAHDDRHELGRGRLLLASTPVPAGRYPALSPARPMAAWFERTIADLWGLLAEGGTDGRPWLDHGRWPLARPLSARPVAQGGEPPQPVFLPVEGAMDAEDVFQYPLGPVLPGGNPAHLRAHLRGGTVLRLEARLGYGHKGLFALMHGKSPRAAARLVARLAGDATVAHAWAFALAAEAATNTPAPPRAALLRAVMAEAERIGNHLLDWGETCAAAGFGWAQARSLVLRERLLHANELAFGQRLLLDRVVPGGVSIDIAASGAEAMLEALVVIEEELPAFQSVHETHAGLQDRICAAAVTPAAAVALLAAGGVAGRSAGRRFDTRQGAPYAPYPSLGFSVPGHATGDADARLRLRLQEIVESLGLIRAALARLEPGPTLVSLPVQAGEGTGMVESHRGEALHWLTLDEAGLIRACFARDASWPLWPLLEAAMQGQAVADLPLCRASLNPSSHGVDL